MTIESVSIETVLNTKELVVNMGPQHPATHGVLRLRLVLDGEKVIDCEPIIGYLHRGVEKLGESEEYPMVSPHLDRTDYTAAVSNVLGYVEAVEKMLGVEVPKRAHYIRTMLTEFQRIASHLIWLGTHALDLGAMTVFLYAFREREEILKLYEAQFGARLTTHAFRIGGLQDDLPEGFVDKAREFVNYFPKKIDEYEQLLTKNRIWLQRTVGVGIISAEDALDFGLTGPPLRGSGVNFDMRKAKPYAAYSDFEFDIPIGRNGDTYDRYLVRMEEMRQSNRILRQVLDQLPDGPVKGKVAKVIKPPVGEIYHAIEAPKGVLGYYVVSDGSTTPYRVRIRPPSFVNLQAIKKMVVGSLVADVIAVIGTLDIVLGEIDR
jgi:NADH-quinone oxidoreductase subunit D